MKFRHLLFAVGAIGLTACPEASIAKKKPEMTDLQLQEMQTKDLDADKNTAFSAVMTVLQNSGYRIGAADRETGLITGIASTNSKTTWSPFVGFGKSKKTPVVSAFIEDISPNATKVRLSFVMTKATVSGFGGGQDEEPILDAAVYQDAFEKIQQAIFVRQSMSGANSPQTNGTAAPQ